MSVGVLWVRERLCVLGNLAQNSWKTRWLQEKGSRWAMECEEAFTHKHTPLDQEDSTTDTLSRCVKLAGPIGVATASWGQHMATSTRCTDPLLPPKLTLILIHTLICTFSPPNKKKTECETTQRNDPENTKESSYGHYLSSDHHLKVSSLISMTCVSIKKFTFKKKKSSDFAKSHNSYSH